MLLRFPTNAGHCVSDPGKGSRAKEAKGLKLNLVYTSPTNLSVLPGQRVAFSARFCLTWPSPA